MSNIISKKPLIVNKLITRGFLRLYYDGELIKCSHFTTSKERDYLIKSWTNGYRLGSKNVRIYFELTYT